MSETKVAVVLGAGPGLGAAVAQRFARGGYAVALMARSPSTLAAAHELVTQAGRPAISLPADATDPSSLSAAFAEVRERLGHPDVFV